MREELALLQHLDLPAVEPFGLSVTPLKKDRLGHAGYSVPIPSQSDSSRLCTEARKRHLIVLNEHLYRRVLRTVLQVKSDHAVNW